MSKQIKTALAWVGFFAIVVGFPALVTAILWLLNIISLLQKAS